MTMLRKSLLILSAALLVGGCAVPSSDNSEDIQGSADELNQKKPLITGHYVITGNQDTEFLVTWPVDLDIAANGKFTGEFNGVAWDDDGLNSQIGTTGKISGSVTFAPSSAAAVKATEGIVTFKYDQGGKDKYKYRIRGNNLDLIYAGAIVAGAGTKNLTALDFAATVQKLGSGNVIKVARK